jgi:hypothetical protein
MNGTSSIKSGPCLQQIAHDSTVIVAFDVDGYGDIKDMYLLGCVSEKYIKDHKVPVSNLEQSLKSFRDKLNKAIS